MGSKSSVSAVLFLSMNIICYALVNAGSTYTSNPTPSPSPSNPKPNPTPSPSPSNPNPSPTPNPNLNPTPSPSTSLSKPKPNPTPSPSTSPSKPKPNPTPSPSNPKPNPVLSPGTSPSNPKPNPMASLVTSNQSLSCPRDALKLGVCGNLLDGLIGVIIGNPPTAPCCTLFGGLVDLEAAVCLCTAIRANVLGINVNASFSLTLLFNACGRTLPPGYTCA